jgi:hypothetical protein
LGYEGFFLGVITIGFIVITIYVPESPKFLIMQRRFTEARLILERISKINGCETFSFEEGDYTTFRESMTCKVAITLNE